ncbi:MAG: hypothetical protein Q8Q80_01170 [Methyloversatilis sp.]|uniref:DUF7931 domain-containing protein n=1 Tax=Methyloversatilis sp. TaxID=2569862 RepID=UPI0027373A97|nr:hypothetical protein [Methyloversatilis sp.]MDP3871248.1 hypothetical protein [Methyloversatilis sp.]
MTDDAEPLRFADQAGYQAAVVQLLDRSRLGLDIFDVDLVDTALASSPRVAQLSDALTRDPAMTVRVVLHDADALQHRMPRLLNLCAAQSHRVHIRQTPRTLRHLTETFMLGIGGPLLIRTHSMHFRGKLLVGNTQENAAYKQRFGELWDACSCCICTTKFGL